MMGFNCIDEIYRYVDMPLSSSFSVGTRLYRVACCCPMGFGWSSAITQEVMLSRVAAVDLDDRHLLADDKPAPNGNDVDEFIAVCTDDVMH